MSGSHISRRDFIKATTGIVSGIITLGLGIPVIGYLLAPALRENIAGKPVAIGNLDEIPVGKPHPFSFTLTKVNGWERTSSSYGGFILRLSEDPNDIKVLSNRCTHLSCSVKWDEKTQVYLCPCHDASFDMKGKIVHGPPPKPLGHFEFEIIDGVITIVPVELESREA